MKKIDSSKEELIGILFQIYQTNHAVYSIMPLEKAKKLLQDWANDKSDVASTRWVSPDGMEAVDLTCVVGIQLQFIQDDEDYDDEFDPSESWKN